MSNTLYKDHGAFLLFSFFFFFYLVSSKPATRVRATDALRTVLVITTTLTFLQYGDFSIFLALTSHYICCGTGIVYCP